MSKVSKQSLKYVIRFNGNLYMVARFKDSEPSKKVVCSVSLNVDEADRFSAYSTACLVAGKFVKSGQFSKYEIVRVES